MELRFLNPDIEGLLPDIASEIAAIGEFRRARLREIAAWIDARAEAGAEAPLTFICTHNSRRSHISQLWAQAFAWKHGLDHVRTASGGTEVTAFHPNAVDALRTCGFDIDGDAAETNPRYSVRYAFAADPIFAFSKTFGDPENPATEFAAVMTCNDADEACPFVPGAAARFSLPYEDPKKADGTPEEALVYHTRCVQIAAEMLYLVRSCLPRRSAEQRYEGG